MPQISSPAWIFLQTDTRLLRTGWRIIIFLVILVAGFIITSLPVFRTRFDFMPVLLQSCMTILCSILMVTIFEHRRWDAFGIQIDWRIRKEHVEGLILAAVMMTVIVSLFVLWSAYSVEQMDLSVSEFADRAISAAVFYYWAAFLEELLFRGYLFQKLIELMKPRGAILVMSVFFGCVHLTNPHVTFFSICNIVLAGIFLSVCYLKTQSLWLCTAAHFGWNYTMGVVYSLPVSGFSPERRGLFHAVTGAPEWLTGGSFGPEGGAAATVILVVAIAFVIKTEYITEYKKSIPEPAPESHESSEA